MLALSSAALLARLHTSSLHNEWLSFIVHHVRRLQESLISNMSPFILKHQRFVTGTWRICLQRNGSGQIDLNLAHWKNVPLLSNHCSFQLKWIPLTVNTNNLQITFHTNYNYRGRVSIRLIKTYFAWFLAQYNVMTSKHLYVHVIASQKQLHFYGFTNLLNLLCKLLVILLVFVIFYMSAVVYINCIY